MIKKVVVISALFSLASLGRLSAQEIFQFTWNFMNPIMMDGEGYAGHSFGANILYKKFGFEIEYAKTGKKHENRYDYLNPQIKVQFANKEDGETSKYKYFTFGFLQFHAIKNTTFYGRGENLQPPYWDTLESAQTYNDYHLSAKTNTNAIQIGFEKVTEKHLTGVAFSHIAIVNPAGMIIGWIIGDGDDYNLDFTRTFRFSLFAAPASWSGVKILSSEPAAGAYLASQISNEKVIMEPVSKNLIGARIGWTWTTLKPFGSSVGIEMTMVPGVFNRPGVYGWGFPDDNIYIKVNFGLAIGNSDKN